MIVLILFLPIDKYTILAPLLAGLFVNISAFGFFTKKYF